MYMSDRESSFMKVLTTVLTSFIIACMIGAFAFIRASDRNDATQTEKIRQNEFRIEIMRTEIRQDLKDIKIDVKNIAESQARNNN